MTSGPKYSPRISRRTLLASLAGTIAAGGTGNALGFPGESKQAARKGVLARPTSTFVQQTRCKLVVEVDGNLRINEPDPKKEAKVRTAEVKGKTTLEYYEQALNDKATAVVAQRQYTVAGTENWISGSRSSIELDTARDETICQQKDGLWQQYCPSTTLTHEEVELTQAPINSTVLELLLPETPAKPEAVWIVSQDDAAQLLYLEAVQKSTLESKIVKVEKGKATISLKGQIDGSAHGAATTLKINGNYQVEIGKNGAYVTWLGIAIAETRAISETEPGFTVNARVRLIRAEAQRDANLSVAAFRKTAEQTNDANWLIKLVSSKGNYEMLADRRWKTFIDGGEEAILRMVENNTIISQCNIMRLKSLRDGQQLTLEALQAEIRDTIGKGFEQFLESSEKLTHTGLRCLRVVAMGTRDDVPIQWVYDHLSDDSGRRIFLVFTMGGNVTDKFAASDEQMTSSFRFTKSVEDETPTAAPLLSKTNQSKKR